MVIKTSPEGMIIPKYHSYAVSGERLYFPTLVLLAHFSSSAKKPAEFEKKCDWKFLVA